MVSLRLVKPSGSRPLIEENRSPTQPTRTLLNGLVDAQPLTGEGSPEGIQTSKAPREYFDLTNKAMYSKFVDAVDGDPKLGWILTSAGLLTNISVSENTQLIIGNKNIKADAPITVTAVDAANASGQEVSINNQSGGAGDLVTFAADVDIEGTVEIPNFSTSSWFFADNAWWLK